MNYNNVNVNVSGPKKDYTSIYKTYILRGNMSFADQVTEPNVKYVIKYDFDLYGGTVTIPEGCLLEFDGGSLSNGNITFNNTKIINNSDKCIFYYDRIKNYLSGTIKNDYLNVLWFGAIPDGIHTYPEKHIINSDDKYDITFEGTDNYDYIQKTIEVCYTTNIKKVFIPKGCYRISKPIQVGLPRDGFTSIEIFGEKLTLLSIVNRDQYRRYGGTTIYADNNYGAFHFDFIRRAKISKINIVGYNAFNASFKWLGSPINHSYDNLSISNWACSQLVSMESYGASAVKPYVGIGLGGHENTYNSNYYPDYTLPNHLGNSMFASGTSQYLLIEECNITGFGIGVAFGIINDKANDDYNKIENSFISDCLYGVSYGGQEGRNLYVEKVNIDSTYTALTNKINYEGKGRMDGLIINCSFIHDINIFDINSSQSSLHLIGAYSEGTFRLGNFYRNDRGNKTKVLTIENSEFLFSSSVLEYDGHKTPNGIIANYLKGNEVVIRATTITVSKYYFIVLSDNNSIKFDNCLFITRNRNVSRESIISIPIVIGADTVLNNHMMIYDDNFIYSQRQFNNTVDYINKRKIPILGGVYCKYTDANQFSINADGIATITYKNRNSELRSIQTGGRPGDLLIDSINGTSFIITEIDNDNYSYVKAKIIGGFRVNENNEVIVNDLPVLNSTYFIQINGRQKSFTTPLIVDNISNNIITLKNWSPELSTDIYIDVQGNYNNELISTWGKISAVDSVNKTITLSTTVSGYSNIISGYIESSADTINNFVN